MSTITKTRPAPGGGKKLKKSAPPQSAPAKVEPAAEPAPEIVEVRRTLGGRRRNDTLATLGAAVAALSISGLLFTEFSTLSGLPAFVVVTYACYLVVLAALMSLEVDGPAIRDRLTAAVVRSAAVVLLSAMVFIIGFTVLRGREALGNLNFFTEDMEFTTPLDPLSEGGILHAIIGTLIQIAIALAITVPLGIITALYLNEIPGRISRFVRTIVEAMTALPSIVAGLFVYSALIWTGILPKSGLAAALAISVMMLPIIIRSADVVFRLVPGNLKEASYALGAGQWRTAWHVTLPTARSGLTTAVILGTARGIGETSPVLLTAGFTMAKNTDPTAEPMVSLPLAVLNFVKSPQPEMIARGFAAGVTLLVLVLLLFVVARLIGGRPAGQLSARASRRRAAASRRDARRRTQAAATDGPDVVAATLKGETS